MHTEQYRFGSSREFFEAVREASRDAELCRRELAALEDAELAISGPSLDAHVRGGSHDVMAHRVVAYVDREASLHARIESDYDLIDAASTVLYGGDGMTDGLAKLCPPWWADAIYHRWVQGRTWDEVAALLCYSVRHVQHATAAAFDLMDANGLAATVAGTGHAEG